MITNNISYAKQQEPAFKGRISPELSQKVEEMISHNRHIDDVLGMPISLYKMFEIQNRKVNVWATKTFKGVSVKADDLEKNNTITVRLKKCLIPGIKLYRNEQGKLRLKLLPAYKVSEQGEKTNKIVTAKNCCDKDIRVFPLSVKEATAKVKELLADVVLSKEMKGN